MTLEEQYGILDNIATLRKRGYISKKFPKMPFKRYTPDVKIKKYSINRMWLIIDRKLYTSDINLAETKPWAYNNISILEELLVWTKGKVPDHLVMAQGYFDDDPTTMITKPYDNTNRTLLGAWLRTKQFEKLFLILIALSFFTSFVGLSIVAIGHPVAFTLSVSMGLLTFALLLALIFHS